MVIDTMLGGRDIIPQQAITYSKVPIESLE